MIREKRPDLFRAASSITSARSLSFISADEIASKMGSVAPNPNLSAARPREFLPEQDIRFVERWRN